MPKQARDKQDLIFVRSIWDLTRLGQNLIKWVQQGQIRSNKVKQVQMGPNRAKQGQTGSNRAKQGQTGPNVAKCGKMKLNTSKHIKTEPKRAKNPISLITNGAKRVQKRPNGAKERHAPYSKQGQMGPNGAKRSQTALVVRK